MRGNNTPEEAALIETNDTNEVNEKHPWIISTLCGYTHVFKSTQGDVTVPQVNVKNLGMGLSIKLLGVYNG